MLFAPPDARAIILYSDLLCNDTCSIWGGHNLLGDTDRKDPELLFFLEICRQCILINQMRGSSFFYTIASLPGGGCFYQLFKSVLDHICNLFCDFFNHLCLFYQINR